MTDPRELFLEFDDFSSRLGGRNPDTGRKVNQHIGGGVKFDYFMIDFHRRGPEEAGQTYDERVLEVL